MNVDQALIGAQKWATQTIVFTLTLENGEKPKFPLETMEVQGHRAHELTNRFYGEAIATCSVDAPVQKVISTLVRKVLDWVTENHKR